MSYLNHIILPWDLVTLSWNDGARGLAVAQVVWFAGFTAGLVAVIWLKVKEARHGKHSHIERSR